jgi:filamentous hemagglutinin family protein
MNILTPQNSSKSNHTRSVSDVKPTETPFAPCFSPITIEVARALAVLSAGISVSAVAPVLAQPAGGQVVSGQATIQQQGNTTQIQQQSQRAIIDWRSFSVGATGTVDFRQPGSGAAILNRVTGNDPSEILGRITANGQVFLVNPNGIVFGKGSSVDVGSLVASTANISNSNFMANRLEFKEPGKAGAHVVNEGSITVAQGGIAALVGPNVSNRGVIQARLGKVALAGGDAFVLDLYGDQLVNLIVEQSIMESIKDASGKTLSAHVNNTGSVIADGGHVFLTVATVSQLLDNIINVQGLIRATSFADNAGVISLRGDARTQVTVGGTLDVSGVKGGSVSITGSSLNLEGSTKISANGANGGGTIEIGGGWQGRGPLPNSQNTTVAVGAQLEANAQQRGNGGTVVVWSDGNTRMHGSISAQGGSSFGDGGNVEISGVQSLSLGGTVTAAAPVGRAGQLLLDPTNLTVAATGSTQLPTVNSPGDAIVSVDVINRALRTGTSVTLQATQDIGINAVIDGRVTAGGTPGASLALDAGRDINFNESIILRDGNLVATATGRITQASNKLIYTGTGAIGLRGAAGVSVNNLATSGAVTLASASGPVSVASVIGDLPATTGGPASRASSLSIVSGGAVLLSGAEIGSGGITIQAIGDVTSMSASTASAAPLPSALNSLGAISISSSSGSVGTSAQKITAVAGGAITLTAAQKIVANDLLTTNSVSLSGATGIDVSAVAGGAGAITATSSAAAELRFQTAGAFNLGTAALGMNGLALMSASQLPTGIAISGPVFSRGVVDLITSGDLLFVGLQASLSVMDTNSVFRLRANRDITTGISGIRSAGGGELSAGEILTIGAGGIESFGVQDRIHASTGLPLSGLTLIGNGALSVSSDPIRSGHGVRLNGSVQVANGILQISSMNGSIRVPYTYVPGSFVNYSNPTWAPSYVDQNLSMPGLQTPTLGGGGDANSSSVLRISSNNSSLNIWGVTLGNITGFSNVKISANGADVRLVGPIGGAETGFSANRVLPSSAGIYPTNNLPTVGALEIAGARHVELNGLNLNGQIGRQIGLSVNATGDIISNSTIALNRGEIKLSAGGWFFIGANIFSRGVDTFTSTASFTREFFPISLTALQYTFFSNSNDPSDTARLVDATVPKITIANNIPYFAASDSGFATPIFSSQNTAGTSPQPISLSRPVGAIPRTFSYLQARTAQADYQGLFFGRVRLLNGETISGEYANPLQGYVSPNFRVQDDYNLISTLAERNPSIVYAPANKFVTQTQAGDFSTQWSMENATWDGQNLLFDYASLPSRAITPRSVPSIIFSSFAVNRSSSYPVVTGDRSNFPQELLSIPMYGFYSDLTYRSFSSTGNNTGEINGVLSGSITRLSNSTAGRDNATRFLVYPGRIETANYRATTDANGGFMGVVNNGSSNGTSQKIGQIGSIGFQSVTGSTSSTGSSSVDVPGQSVSVLNGFVPARPTDIPVVETGGPTTGGPTTGGPTTGGPTTGGPTTGGPTTGGPTTGGPTTGGPTTEGVVDSRPTFNVSLVDLLLERQQAALELVFGARPGSEADLGRTSALSGTATNVFQRRYRLAQSANPAVCAPADIERTEASRNPSQQVVQDCAK